MSFETLGLSAELLRTISEKGYCQATPIHKARNKRRPKANKPKRHNANQAGTRRRNVPKQAA